MNVFFTILTVFLALHPVHLSVTNIEHTNKGFEISVRLFEDDFQKNIYRNYGVNLNLGKPNELPDADKYINLYISSHFKLFANGKQISSGKFKLKSREIKDVTLWLHYSVKYTQKLNKIKIENSLMTDLFSDQKNLVIFTSGNFQKPLEFNAKHTTESFAVN